MASVAYPTRPAGDLLRSKREALQEGGVWGMRMRMRMNTGIVRAKALVGDCFSIYMTPAPRLIEGSSSQLWVGFSRR